MKPVAAKHHFGNFLRWRYDLFGGQAAVARRSKEDASKGLSETKLAQLTEEPVPPESLRNTSRIILAKALDYHTAGGEGDWDALDRAWQQEAVPPYPRIKPPRFGPSEFIEMLRQDVAAGRTESLDKVLSLVPEFTTETVPVLGYRLLQLDDDVLAALGSYILPELMKRWEDSDRPGTALHMVAVAVSCLSPERQRCIIDTVEYEHLPAAVAYANEQLAEKKLFTKAIFDDTRPPGTRHLGREEAKKLQAAEEAATAARVAGGKQSKHPTFSSIKPADPMRIAAQKMEPTSSKKNKRRPTPDPDKPNG